MRKLSKREPFHGNFRTDISYKKHKPILVISFLRYSSKCNQLRVNLHLNLPEIYSRIFRFKCFR